ncbi:thiamine diphosphokinase [Orbaceae bacterium ESL0721]|nr:thiamine diphosphokinase [Orbaceae bacterium ESL0721]
MTDLNSAINKTDNKADNTVVTSKTAISKTALLFVNGEPPQQLPKQLGNYTYIACTDGAYHSYLSKTAIVPNFIIGDLDSIDKSSPVPAETEIVVTPDQNRTDFEKALLFLIDKGVKKFAIFGATGRDSGHFLGNLSVAMQYYKQYKLTFYDDYCTLFFSQKNEAIRNIKEKIITLIPLSPVKKLTLIGFKYPLNNATLQLGKLISLRNQAIEDTVKITFDKGDLLVIITK